MGWEHLQNKSNVEIMNYIKYDIVYFVENMEYKEVFSYSDYLYQIRVRTQLWNVDKWELFRQLMFEPILEALENNLSISLMDIDAEQIEFKYKKIK
ncbi:hypothetical protein [Isobaculum melis]|uniref:Uncharacterized protein n=1 Tax=Isobaculum melis TaxID=142588 RepID=A0A1H9TPD5_9LACT|nr:hypothetical protein [Isobaculum melis]SER98975.1 hypothetical protein SAMN04488559_11537 [Isobaculum melis]